MAKNKIGIAVEDDLHKQVKSTAPLRGMNIEGAYDQALRMWLGHEPPARYRKENEAAHDKLETILNSEDIPTKEAITANVEVFFDRLRGSSKSARTKQAESPKTPDEERLLNEYRNSSMEKRRRMLAFAAKTEEPPGPEIMPGPTRSARRKSG